MLNGARIIAKTNVASSGRLLKGAAVFVRIPEAAAEPIPGGCSCDWCRAHPQSTPSWDTLVIPLDAGEWYAHTVHCPNDAAFRENLRRNGKLAKGF